jgi:putative transposase
MKENISFFDLSEEKVKEIEEKYALIEPLLDSYLPNTEKRRLKKEACDRLGISDRTLRRLIHKLKKKGIMALVRRRRSDAGSFRKFDKRITDAAIKLLEENPFRSIPMLMKLLEVDSQVGELVKSISCHTLYYHLKMSGYDFKRKNKISNKIYTRFEADYPNQLWQGDARDGIYLPDPLNLKKMRKTYLFAWIDDFSRKIMYARYYWDEKLPRMEDCFRQAVLRWAIPEKIYCDNGKVYISKYFLFLVNALKIKKIHHPAYCAWCKGKVENCMKSFKRFQREAVLAGFKTMEEFNSALWAWIEVEYNNKTHSVTGETPNHRYSKGIIKHPPKRVKDIDEFNRLFLFRETRKVNKYGKIQLEKNYYPVKGIVPRTRVQVLFDPFNLEEVLVYFEDNFYCKSKASSLKTKSIIKNIPSEVKKPDISKAAVNYFRLLREKHNEILAIKSEGMRFSLLREEDKKDE